MYLIQSCSAAEQISPPTLVSGTLNAILPSNTSIWDFPDFCAFTAQLMGTWGKPSFRWTPVEPGFTTTRGGLQRNPAQVTMRVSAVLQEGMVALEGAQGNCTHLLIRTRPHPPEAPTLGQVSLLQCLDRAETRVASCPSSYASCACLWLTYQLICHAQKNAFLLEFQELTENYKMGTRYRFVLSRTEAPHTLSQAQLHGRELPAHAQKGPHLVSCSALAV